MRIQRAFAGNGSGHAPDAAPTHDLDLESITFQPELMVRWDDETARVERPTCERPGRIATRPAARSIRR